MNNCLYESKKLHVQSESKLQNLREKYEQLPQNEKVDFLEQIYLPELSESFYQESVWQFELRFPLGNETHEKAYFDSTFEKLNHF